MSRNRAAVIAGLMALTMGWSPQGGALSAQAPAAADDTQVLKVDVVLTRSTPGAKEDPRLQAAQRNLARQEALFQKGLVSQAVVDQTRIQVRQLETEQAATSRLPYSLLVPLNGQRTSLRFDVTVPYGTALKVAEGGIKSTERQYHPTGTNIDCTATRASDGRYRLVLSVADTSIVPSDRVEAASAASGTQAVAFRSWSVSNTLYVRDGQTLPFSVGTDRITGETLRAEVTATLQK